MCIFCYRALLYNFVIKFKYRCCPIWCGDDARGLKVLVNVGKHQATCTELLSSGIAFHLWICLGRLVSVKAPLRHAVTAYNHKCMEKLCRLETELV